MRRDLEVPSEPSLAPTNDPTSFTDLELDLLSELFPMQEAAAAQQPQQPAVQGMGGPAVAAAPSGYPPQLPVGAMPAHPGMGMGGMPRGPPGMYPMMRMPPNPAAMMPYGGMVPGKPGPAPAPPAAATWHTVLTCRFRRRLPAGFPVRPGAGGLGQDAAGSDAWYDDARGQGITLPSTGGGGGTGG